MSLRKFACHNANHEFDDTTSCQETEYHLVISYHERKKSCKTSSI